MALTIRSDVDGRGEARQHGRSHLEETDMTGEELAQLFDLLVEEIGTR